MDNARTLFAEARQYIPGGVNSPVRAFEPVGGTPPFIERAEGSRVVDSEGNRYIDFVGSYGPLILGHAPEPVVDKLRAVAENGTSFGAPTRRETELAREICARVPGADKVRLVNSGTEATMTALRVARGVTGRDRVIKFGGCYHGHSDSFLVEAGSGAATLGRPNSPGVPAGVVSDTLVAEFNNIDSVREQVGRHQDEVAAVIVEPVCGNSGVIPPENDFLAELRDVTAGAGALLIFDEVMTGFRVDYHSAQGLYDVEPDLTTLGKVIGGGMPIGAVAGKEEIMNHLAPAGPVYQAGTLSGNPVAVAAGLATLRALGESQYEYLDDLGGRLETGVNEVLETADINGFFQRVGSMCCLFFHEGPISSGSDARDCNTEHFAQYFRHMLQSGIYLPPSQFESFFLSTAHTPEDVDLYLKACRDALSRLD
ncbi:MAG: glutamate-1-semialdehyde 2,1-aminomutase [Planctomycetota bacterium]